MAELFPPLTMLLISPLLQSVTHLRPQIPALSPRRQAKNLPFQNMGESGNTLQGMSFCFMFA